MLVGKTFSLNKPGIRFNCNTKMTKIFPAGVIQLFYTLISFTGIDTVNFWYIFFEQAVLVIG